MKINKLYTLSQFVDLVTQSKDNHFCNEEVVSHAEDNMETDLVVCAVAELIESYNNFLKQLIKKEMFVNRFKKPLECYSSIGGSVERAYYKKMEWWEESEKKVIFEDVEILPYSNQTVLFDIFVNKKFIARTRGDETWAFNNNTLSDLAEMTKGELTLRNVEI